MDYEIYINEHSIETGIYCMILMINGQYLHVRLFRNKGWLYQYQVSIASPFCNTQIQISKAPYVCVLCTAGCKIECFCLAITFLCHPHSPNSIPVCQNEPQLQIVTVWVTPDLRVPITSPPSWLLGIELKYWSNWGERNGMHSNTLFML